MRGIELFCNERGISFRKKEHLLNFTTIRIGGIADIVAFPDEENIIALLNVVKNEGLPYFVIGGGSNLLVSDNGFRGVIINTKKMSSIKIDGTFLKVSAGAMLSRVLSFLLKKNLSGLEGLIGIPGTIGGAIFCNAGSFGYEIKDCLVEIDVIDDRLEIKTLKKEEIKFSYRSSGLPENFIIKSATFQLKETEENIFLKMRDYIEKKRKSQPLRAHSAGCVFKNPEGTSAGYLIDKAGLKGTKVGDIIISSVHANYFVNTGKGNSRDFLKLMNITKERVFKVFNLELEPEIRFLEA